MGLLDTTIDNIDKKITQGLITHPGGLGFVFSSEHFFKKDVYINKKGFNLYAVCSINSPTFPHISDEVEVSVSFVCGHYMDIESQIYKTISSKIEPMKFKTNLYESIKIFLDEDNIISYLTDRLKLNLLEN